jgi:hypothetical protein
MTSDNEPLRQGLIGQVAAEKTSAAFLKYRSESIVREIRVADDLLSEMGPGRSPGERDRISNCQRSVSGYVQTTFAELRM